VAAARLQLVLIVVFLFLRGGKAIVGAPLGSVSIVWFHTVRTLLLAQRWALVLSPLRVQQFGILCLTVCVIQLLGLISFDVT